MRQPNPVKTLPQAHKIYLAAALFLTGGVSLVLEIVGTRVISPFYGSSLYCWSALITVTLVSLAAGYNWGGRLADRDPSLTLFSRLICLAGASAALIPLLRIPALKATAPLGIQLGALSSALLLIAPALVLLSTLGPIAIKLSTQAMASVGRSSGDVYAVSTLGSVTGAVLAGFVLIPHCSISRILYGISCLLLLLGCVGYWLSRESLPLPQLAAAAAVALFGFWPQEEPQTNMLLSTESAYGQIKVLDFNNRRYLLVNGTTQSMAFADTLESDSQYAQAMEWAALIRPQAKSGLVIGVGAGLLPGVLEKHYGLSVDAVDIDPKIIDAAKTYFGYTPRGGVFLEDGRTFLERSERRYGTIFLDAFGTETPPYHLFTEESFTAMRRVLEPDGVLSVNLVSLIHGKNSLPWRSAYKTLRAVFPEVRAFSASEPFHDLGNVVFFCSGTKISGAGVKAPRGVIKNNLEYMLAHELIPTQSDLDDAVLMTDDHAPLESMLAATSVVWRKGLQEKVASVLLY